MWGRREQSASYNEIRELKKLKKEVNFFIIRKIRHSTHGLSLIRVGKNA